MRILGIDCGSERTGYGVIDTDGRRHRLVTYGVVRTSPKAAFAGRLGKIHTGICDVIASERPEAVAVEEVFHSVNAKSALKLAHVRGVALLCAAQHELPVGEYSPLEIKGAVVGYGRAEKSQVQMMVASLLGLSEAPSPHDAADALAVALCHATQLLMNAALMQKPRGSAHA